MLKSDTLGLERVTDTLVSLAGVQDMPVAERMSYARNIGGCLYNDARRNWHATIRRLSVAPTTPMQMDIDDMHAKFRTKYDANIQQLLDYATSLNPNDFKK